MINRVERIKGQPQGISRVMESDNFCFFLLHRNTLSSGR
ncbi:metal-sensing transcriptional repressor [Pseudogracilibacillus auburnensis]